MKQYIPKPELFGRFTKTRDGNIRLGGLEIKRGSKYSKDELKRLGNYIKYFDLVETKDPSNKPTDTKQTIK